MKKISRLTALLLALMMFMTMFAYAEDGVPQNELDMEMYNTMLSDVQSRGLIDSAYEYYVNELVALDVEARYEKLVKWYESGILGDVFYEGFISYYKTAHAGEGLICICPEPQPYGTAKHTDADCAWSFANLPIAEQYDIVQAMDAEQKAAFEATLDAVTLDALKRVNATAYTAFADSVSVSISVPEDAFDEDYQLQANEVKVSDVQEAIESAINVALSIDSPFVTGDVVAFDISFLKLTDETAEMQPASKVGLSFDLSNAAFGEDVEELRVYHMVEKADGSFSAELVKAVSPLTKVINVEADSFSIYAITGTYFVEGTSESIADDGNYQMTIGQTQNFYWVDNNYRTDGYYTWSVDNDENAISWTVYRRANPTGYTGENDSQYYQYPYISVTALSPGEATLTLKYYFNDDQNKGQVSFTINVSEGEFYIDDQVAESGCIVAAGSMFEDGKVPEDVELTWTRNDGAVIKTEAIVKDETTGQVKAINVALDRAGAYQAQSGAYVHTTYTLTATKNGEIVGTATFRVPYGREILNGSFETPDIGDVNHTRIPNGTEGFYWMTTGPGVDGKLSYDIEIVHGYGYHTVSRVPDGKQFVEVNAEEFGTLYQDILTAPGATLNWSFSHGGRSGSNNTIYVILASSETASHVVDATDVAALLEKVGNGSTNGDQDYKATLDDGTKITFRIWKHDAEVGDWNTFSGSYNVPDDQYLTRLFFAAQTGTDNATMGNLIDGAVASESLSYKIEYYFDNKIQAVNTETGSAAVYTPVAPQHLDKYTGKVLTGVTINGVPYSGDIHALLVAPYLWKSDDDKYPNIFRFYYVDKAITIRKNVEIEGFETLDASDLNEMLSGYKANFELKQGSSVVATAEIAISYNGSNTITALGEFKADDNQTFVPPNGTYTISETDETSPLAGYTLIDTIFTGVGDNQTVTISDDNPSAAVICTNTYAPNSTLTISKTGMEYGEAALFTVKVGDKTYKIALSTENKYTAVISNLPIGSVYEITEDDDWSWRYSDKTYTYSNEEHKIDVNGSSVSIVNERETDQWLSDESAVDNKFATVTETATE